MIFAAIDLLTTDIEALGWVERYGRLTTPVRIIDHQDRETEEQTFVIFPVSCNVTAADCLETDTRYYPLVPDSTKKSIAYWEQQGGFSFTNENDGFLTGSAVARFVAWLNISELGKTDCTITADIIGPLLNTLDVTKTPTSGVFTNGQIKFKVIEQVEKSADIFSAYTYDNQETGYLLFPYDYFALDVEISLKIDKNCFSAFTTESAITCQTY